MKQTIKTEDLKRLGTKETAKRIRQHLKKFTDLKFSVRMESYSMGSSIHIHLMESKKNVLLPYTILKSYNPEEPIKKIETEKHQQLNQYHINKSNVLNNYGIEIFNYVNNYIKGFHSDNSDARIDYFDVNFYYHLNVGKWDKPYKVTG